MEDKMSEYSNEPIVPGSSPQMSMIETWTAAFTRPWEETYTNIAAQPGATATKAFLWVFIASMLTTLVSLIAGIGGQQMENFRQLLPPEIASQLPAGADSAVGIGTIICGVPVGAVFAVLGFAIGTALIQWVARLFGGTGTFDKLAYTFSSITVPYSVVAAILALLAMIPYVGILTGLISFGLSIYLIVLEVMAVKAVHRLDTVKAAGSVLLPGFVILLILCCCLLIIASVLAPVMGETFQGLY